MNRASLERNNPPVHPEDITRILRRILPDPEAVHLVATILGPDHTLIGQIIDVFDQPTAEQQLGSLALLLETDEILASAVAVPYHEELNDIATGPLGEARDVNTLND